jgi:DeoR/GlpR family transcriptional regulator of sugar metabolism
MTVDVPALSNVERQELIVRYIERHQRASIEQLVQAFTISPATARRDLEVLVERGQVRRVHGGAIAIRQSTPPELPALERQSEQADEKRRIGAAAAQLIKDGDTIFIGGGTTTLEVARNLRNRPNLTVITNSLLIINLLADVEAITVIGLGGMLRRSEMSQVGHVTEQALKELRADKVFMGIRAIDLEDGFTNDYSPEVTTDRAIFRMGREVIVVADHTKCGRVSAAFVAPLNAVHTLVTDAGTSSEFISVLQERGIKTVQL